MGQAGRNVRRAIWPLLPIRWRRRAGVSPASRAQASFSRHFRGRAATFGRGICRHRDDYLLSHAPRLRQAMTFSSQRSRAFHDITEGVTLSADMAR